MKNFKLCFLIAILFVFAFNSNSEALINTKYFSLNGSLQTYYQYYYAEGVENRDSPNTFHFNISPTFTFFGIDFSVQSDLDYYFTTDPKFYLPSFNYLSIRPNWNWGGLELMDFSPYFSDLTLNGITLRGAALDLHPGNFQLYILGGDMKADSSVVYDRRYYGMRMQIGGFSLNVVQASDKAFHLSEEDSTLTAPEENLVVGCQMAFEAWKTDVNLEVAGAAYTRDIYAQKLDYDNSFSFIEGIYTPRHSSYADIAYAINANYPLSIGNIKGAFQYVGPGYTSLGLYSSNNDQLEFEFDLNLRPHPMISFSGNYNQNRNNLLYNLVATTFNRNLSIYTSFFPASFFSNSIYYYWYGSNKDSQDDSSFFDNSTHSISFSPYLYFGLFKLYHSLSASYSHTQQQEKNPLNPYVNKTNSASSNLSSQISSGFSTNLGVSWISTHSDGTRVEYMTYSAGANFDLFNGVLPVYSNLSYSPGTAGNLFDAYVSPSLTITSKDVIDFDFNYSNFSTANDDSTDYNEFTFKVSYSRYF